MKATYWRELPAALAREQESSRPSIKVNLVMSNRTPTLVTPLTGRQKLAKKVHLLSPGQLQGFKAEERLITVLCDFIVARRAPRSMVSVRHASHHEEAIGVDCIVATTLGEVPLQVKSSLLGKEKFRLLSDRRHIGCVVVEDHAPDVAIFWTAVDEISLACEHIYGRQLTLC